MVDVDVNVVDVNFAVVDDDYVPFWFVFFYLFSFDVGSMSVVKAREDSHPSTK